MNVYGQMPPMMYAQPPPPAPKSTMFLLIAMVLVLVVLAAGGGFWVSSRSTKSVVTSSAINGVIPSTTADAPACAGVLLYSGKTVGSGDQYCAKPGTGPSDLPFVPQSFLIPQGSTLKWTIACTTDANNNTGSMNMTASAPGSISNLPATIIKVNTFSVSN